ncbi:hypothetical protein GCM10023350_29090 [Nocardioides endophyticus]|uniref:Uncharacterized protein n=1 Tax=Nocardioides endophyticus TaxID=1353775 RepID=A0ABP8YZS8_9ACTN
MRSSSRSAAIYLRAGGIDLGVAPATSDADLVNPSGLRGCMGGWPGALLIAKSAKLAERVERVEARPDRLVDKDATDVVRLMMATHSV